MNKIPYPINPLRRRQFEKDYFNLLQPNLEETKINEVLNSITFNGTPLSLKIILTSHFTELISIINSIDNYFSNINNILIRGIKKRKFSNYFNYTSNQPKIASFFMTQPYFDISTCFYCSIDYVNAFKDISDYEDHIEFVNNASTKELNLIKGLGSKKIKKIINERPIINLNNLEFSSNIITRLLDFKKLNSHNHFTLDHVIPQSKYKYLSLSLYNFVPSCYSCNSKFKKNTDLGNINVLKYISPSSDEFSLTNDMIFKIYYHRGLKHVNNTSDFVLKESISGGNKDAVQNYLDIFKISGRYVFHKPKIHKLIEKKVRYPDTKISQIAHLLKINPQRIKNDIFGNDIFDNNSTEPLGKLKKDIARQIKIIP